MAAAILAASGAACFNPSYDRPACSPAGECPDGFRCVAGTCEASGGDDAGDIDAPPGPFEVVHLQGVTPMAGAADWTPAGSPTISTSQLTVTPPLPPGIPFMVETQASGGPDVATLYVGNLTVPDGVIIRVSGSRPLAIVASGTVVIAGVVDASATRDSPGPGASAINGPGQGGNGEAGTGDSGAGGGGYGSPGGRGGDSPGQVGGAAGPTYGSTPPTALLPGSPGGRAGMRAGCPSTIGGAGGGAILIAAQDGIDISGLIDAGGGGGFGGAFCSGSALGGTGGGSGGQIDLQAPVIGPPGLHLIASGGSGGSGGETSGMGGEGGVDAPTSGAAAQGGPSVGMTSGSGGDGAAVGAAGDGDNADNGGGGGGGNGRITVWHRGARPGIGGVPAPTFATF